MKRVCLILIMSLVLPLSGCYSISVEDLYSLPRASEKNVALQALINDERAAGSEFSAPMRGSYRQSVQQYDIDGDGVDETFAFFLDTDKTLKICVYTGNGGDGEYSQAMSIRGEGASIGSIEYADIDGDGVSDLIVEWQSGTGDMRLLQAFAMGGFEGACILTASSTEFRVADFNGDGVSDIAVMWYDNSAENSETPTGEIELFCFSSDGEPMSSGGKLSRGLGQGTVTRMRTGLLEDLTPALFVEGYYGENELITDIFAYRDGAFRNITLQQFSGVSRDTIRLNYREPYSQDIDKDRALETPETVPMYVQEGTAGFYYFDWYGYGIDGKKKLDLSTYHSSDGWYLVLPSEWRSGLTVRRAEGPAGERTIILSTYDPITREVHDFLAVYTLTGDNRLDRARLPGRFILKEDDMTTIYAARILRDETQWEHARLPGEIAENFKIIYSEWSTGAI